MGLQRGVSALRLRGLRSLRLRQSEMLAQGAVDDPSQAAVFRARRLIKGGFHIGVKSDRQGREFLHVLVCNRE